MRWIQMSKFKENDLIAWSRTTGDYQIGYYKERKNTTDSVVYNLMKNETFVTKTEDLKTIYFRENLKVGNHVLVPANNGFDIVEVIEINKNSIAVTYIAPHIAEENDIALINKEGIVSEAEFEKFKANMKKDMTITFEKEEVDDAGFIFKVNMTEDLRNLLLLFCKNHNNITDDYLKEGNTNYAYKRIRVYSWMMDTLNSQTRYLFSEKLLKEGSDTIKIKNIGDINQIVYYIENQLPRIISMSQSLIEGVKRTIKVTN